MAKIKYYDKINGAIEDEKNANKRALPPFNFNDIAPKSRLAKIKSNLTHAILKPLYWFGRHYKPVLNIGGFRHVLRDAEVRQILSRPMDFQVPFGAEMNDLAKGATFTLGLEGKEQERQNALIRKIIRPQDSILIVNLTNRFSTALLENSGGQIDVIRDYFQRSVAEVCIRYFGFSTDEPAEFADWVMSATVLLFADPYGDEELRKLAKNGSERICAMIDDSIARMRIQYNRYGPTDAMRETLLGRLLIMQSENANSDPISDMEMRAILFGLVTGFIPTNTLAGGKMLAELLKRPDAMKMATEAAANNDREVLKKILIEAGRLNPALAPGQWRYCPKDTYLTVNGKDKPIKAGSLLLVSTMSAMRDHRVFPKPSKFWPDRVDGAGNWVEPDLIFGAGIHECIGKYLALDQITELCLPLLRAKNIRPAPGKAGKLTSISSLPRHLEMHYDTPASEQSMFIILAPLLNNITKDDADAQIAALGNPAEQNIREAMDATGIVHFTSLSTIQTEKDVKLSFELSVDGNANDALKLLNEHAEEYLRPIFKLTGLDEDENLTDYMQRHIVNLHSKPWGPTGLNYNGLSEFSIPKVEKQKQFSDFAERVLRDYVTSQTHKGSHPSLIMDHFRKILRNDPVLKYEATKTQLALMKEAQEKRFDAFHLVTEKMRLQITQYREKTHLQNAMGFFKSKDFRPFALSFLFLTIAAGFVVAPAFGGGLIAKILLVSLSALLISILISAMLLGAFIGLIRYHEKKDKVNDKDAPLAKLRHIINSENPHGFQQNHVMAVGRLKAGLFRKLLHAFTLAAINISIAYWFRPGLLNRMGTIHYARWWRIPGTDTVSFYSNFDGSWESYLEDFILRNRWGQAAAWSNWQGFPKTRFLVFGGAGNADEFKRWVRNVQQISPFWYSRFPEMTTEHIRNNGIIHIGAGLARSATENEEWIRCFSSMPRLENRIETDEVQALIFRGMKRLPYSKCLAIRIPDNSKDIGEWLSTLSGKPMTAEALLPNASKAAIKKMVNAGILITVPKTGPNTKKSADEYMLSHAMTITYGDRYLNGEKPSDSDGKNIQQRDAQAAMAQAVIFGLSAAGIEKFNAPNTENLKLQRSFPTAFRMGMAGRGKILGDMGEHSPDKWRWNDDPNRNDATEAVLMLYAADKDALSVMEQTHETLIKHHGGDILSSLDCAPAWDEAGKEGFEHFGFRDGISQPIIKGTSRNVKNVPERDIAEAGEYILGYPDSLGYSPASPILPKEADMARALPVVIDENLSKYPDFGNENLSDAPRDLGRNGSFLVIRELKQDVEGFHNFSEDAAQKLNEDGYQDLYKIIGQAPNSEWVKAKLMGRWRNGRPLIGNPIFRQASEKYSPAERENDFSYGADDPHGLACPFGSHIRRTNPRDSKLPGDKGALEISNRHRILRRGRSYTKADTGEKGLLFACFCTDIDRQFEFVQQFWSNASSFHGLKNEPDPITGVDDSDPQTLEAKERVFTIPTPSGPIKLEGLQSFVHMMGGGYFFVPSRSAVSWFSNVALHAANLDNDTENQAS